MEQCNCIICVHAALLNLDILRHQTVHLLFSAMARSSSTANPRAPVRLPFTQLAVISLTDGIRVHGR